MNDKKFEIKVKSFDELDVYELYEILKLREEVFCVEQDCPYVDCDRKDFKALHLQILCDGEIAAYTRLLPAGVSYENEASIGRVIVREKYRKNKLGYMLMKESIKAVRDILEEERIRISAQHRLLNFYSNLGFSPVGDIYPEDGIPHIAMVMDIEKE